MKLKPDFKSISFKTFAYFVLFAGVLMILLWSLQVLFLNSFYGIMKSNQTKTVAKELQTSYAQRDEEAFANDVNNLSRSYDLVILVGTYTGGLPRYYHHASLPVDNLQFYKDEANYLYSELKATGETSTERNPRDEMDVPRKMFAYATMLEGTDYTDAVILYVFSPLSPITSTAKIMTAILIYVTIISLVLATIISLYLSRRITRPIRKITGSAERLAQGEYGIVFKGGHYTELNQLADTLTSASIELEKSDMLQKDLIANVSHDLRTPLTMIRSYAEMIRDLSGDNPEKREQHLQVIIDESDRLNALVNDLLAVSRLQSGKITIEIEEFNISEAVRSIVETYRIMEEEEGYHFVVDCPATYIVYGDPERISQVIGNLFTNAIKFCGEDRVIRVSLSRKGRTVRCSVGDHGPGIAPEELDHIWERYYRSSSNTVRTAEGTGLGLSIVKEVLTLHKANFGVDSTVGVGTTFWFELDLIREEEDAANG